MKMESSSSKQSINNLLQNNNARFMQPLIPHFVNTFSIPEGFLKRLKEDLELKQGDAVESVVLTTEEQPHRHWVVKVEGGRNFKEGWKDFCRDHDLQVGDFMVFTHLVHLLFQVSVFDPSTACQRLTSIPNSSSSCNTTSMVSTDSSSDSDSDSDSYPDSDSDSGNLGWLYIGTGTSKAKKKRGLKSKSSDGKSDPKRPRKAQLVETMKPSSSKKKTLSSFRVTLTSFAFNNAFLYVPKYFISGNGLTKKRCNIKLMNKQGGSWQAKLSYRKYDSQSFISGGGWKKFQVANHFKVGHILSFHLLQSGRCPVFKCFRIKSVSMI